MKNVTQDNASKASDWKCTGGINAGSDSYRTYESISTNEHVVIDGKNEHAHLSSLRDQQPND